ncbi:2S albumin-like [Eucalyptus grandis]|uniref:Bifunctional inhibitor/plant lipid transfer protein/seed storage helical domain-containing protein n=1 Tax=Eucalyptus globulus TaxID=34317 RepID=A0ABD3K5B5_EUCGL|nr:2S albumin-like [Eucalyptus grandis]
MAKLATLAAIFAAFLLMSHVIEAHWTTITSVEIDEEAPRRSGSCHEQLHRQDLNRCEQLFEDIARGSPGRRARERMESSESLRPCCEQLRQVQEGCRCEGIRQVARGQQGEFRGEGSLEVARSARRLPSTCGVAPQHCEIKAAWY